jgi:hypothetical protein
MLPRWLTGAIIVFWLGMTGWLAYQQYSLRQRAGEPPPFTIDLTDEVGANEISWNVMIDGKKQGQAYSSVKFRRKDHTFAFKSWLRANDIQLAKLLPKAESLYRVNDNGELTEFEITLVLEQSADQKVLFGAVVNGKVDKGAIQPKVWVIALGAKVDSGISLREIKVAKQFLNPMHLLNKVSGLHEGQEWPIQLMEIAGFSTMSLPIVMAKVSGETLSWDGRDVSCYLIEYRELRKQKVHARTWVRQRDGVVLQQQAEYMGRELLFQREINRKQ